LRALFGESPLQYKAGTLIVPAGGEHPFVYRLVTGFAGRSRLLADGRRQLILMFFPGDIFGLKNVFLRNGPEEIVALSPMEAERVEGRAMLHAFMSDPDVALRCTYQVIDEERRLHKSVVALGQCTAEEKVASLLLDVRARLVDAGVIRSSQCSYSLPLTQGEIADYVGITAVHLNRVLASLRGRGIACFTNRRVVIQNLPALQRAASALDATSPSPEPALTAHHF